MSSKSEELPNSEKEEEGLIGERPSQKQPEKNTEG